MKKLPLFSGSLVAVVLAALIASFSLETVAQTDPGATAALDAALAGSHRSERNKARDRYRHPKETLTFRNTSTSVNRIA